MICVLGSFCNKTVVVIDQSLISFVFFSASCQLAGNTRLVEGKHSKMADWTHCNICMRQPSTDVTFFLTGCGHILCKKCVENGAFSFVFFFL
jgi:hypothetical protein